MQLKGLKWNTHPTLHSHPPASLEAPTLDNSVSLFQMGLPVAQASGVTTTTTPPPHPHHTRWNPRWQKAARRLQRAQGSSGTRPGAGLGHCQQTAQSHPGSVPNPAMGLGLAGSILDLPERASVWRRLMTLKTKALALRGRASSGHEGKAHPVSRRAAGSSRPASS